MDPRQLARSSVPRSLPEARHLRQDDRFLLVTSIMPKNPAAVAHGPMLIGVTINVLLMGVIVMQAYEYFTSYKRRDDRYLKSLVVFVFCANILNTGFAVADVYLALINHFGDVQYLTVSTWLFVTDPVIVGTVACSVQMFFAWRVQVLTGRWYLGLLTASLALGQLICAMLMAWKCHQYPAWADFVKFTDLIIAWMTTTILVDVTITIILVWYLRRHKTGLEGTDQVVDRLIRLTVQTGMLTSVWALLDLVLFLTQPTDASHLIFQIPMVKMYTNSLMSSLNSRPKPKVFSEVTDNIHSIAKFVNHRTTMQDGTMQFASSLHPEAAAHLERHELGEFQKKTIEAASSGCKGDAKTGWDNAARAI
ncbi:hypothetical protein B0H15DRAFT_817319 [Mycena belliarum]|uniref:DUF6534 domain-containing protein n=1 Tax=Mycena belliarum TaxID=1033014 RepID=A0AAD6UJB8_9AGAR|nr:hypothetical protein B0H15DRAFT_817319 [Mycena belliae]